MSKYRMAQVSAVLNLLGSVLVFVSFQVTATKFNLVFQQNQDAALCVGDHALFIMQGKMVGMGVKCPEGVSTPTAVVNTNAPWLMRFGWLLVGIGFLLQALSIEPSTLTAEDLRVLRKARKLISTSARH